MLVSIASLRNGVTIALVLLSLAGCSISADAIGRVGKEATEFRGHATGYMDGTGTIDMVSADGTKCLGEFRYTGTKTGVGMLRCNDGRIAHIQFNALSMASGYGYGRTNAGEPVLFTFGLSDAASAPYLAPARASANAPQQPRRPQSSSGTGFYINDRGHVLTNEHVIDECSKITIHLPDGTTSSGHVVASDEGNDLAVVLASNRPPAAAVFTASPTYRPGDPVLVFGYPLAGALLPQEA